MGRPLVALLSAWALAAAAVVADAAPPPHHRHHQPPPPRGNGNCSALRGGKLIGKLFMHTSLIMDCAVNLTVNGSAGSLGGLFWTVGGLGAAAVARVRTVSARVAPSEGGSRFKQCSMLASLPGAARCLSHSSFAASLHPRHPTPHPTPSR